MQAAKSRTEPAFAEYSGGSTNFGRLGQFGVGTNIHPPKEIRYVVAWDGLLTGYRLQY
jgi:hypothetical protein